MVIGKVVGTVISTRKNANLVGSKFLIIDSMEGMDFSQGQTRVVAVDSIGAGIGEIVLVAIGSAARAGNGNENSPVDACVVGIVDDPDKIVIEK